MKRLALIFAFLLLCGAAYGQTCPNQVASDNFTRANASTLGSNWTVIQGTWSIVSDTAVNSSAPGNSNPVYWSANSLPGQQCAGAKWASYTSSTPGARYGPAIYVQSGAKSGYYVYCNNVTSGSCTTLVLAKDSADSVTTLQTINSLSISAGTEVMLEGNGSGTLSVWVNGSQVGTNTTDTTFEAGYGGLMAFNSFTNSIGFTFFEVGGASSPTAANPTFTPASGLLVGATGTVTVCSSGCTSGASNCVTTDGSTPTATTPGTCSHGSTVSNGGTISLSASSTAYTVEALATLSGDTNSSVVSTTFQVYQSYTVATDNFSAYFNSNLQTNKGSSGWYQLPLDAPWTQILESCSSLPCTSGSGTNVAAWTANGATSGASAGDYVYPQTDSVTSAYGVVGNSTAGYATRTGETYTTPQGSQLQWHQSSGNGPLYVGVWCGTGSTVTGGFLKISYNAVSVVEITSGSSNTLGTASFTPSDGDMFTMYAYGSTYVPLRNGSQITGLNATYTATLSSGEPCIGAVGASASSALAYSWTGFDLATSTPTSSPNSYTETYSNYNFGTVTSGTTVAYPWFSNGLSTQGLMTVAEVNGNYGNAESTVYAYGSSASSVISQMQYQVPSCNPNCWISAEFLHDTLAWNNRNSFLKLQSTSVLPPTSEPSSGCYDPWAIYIGVEPIYQAYNYSGGGYEYQSTNFLHSTYVNEASSLPYPSGGCTTHSNYNVLTAFGTIYVVMHTDIIMARFLNNTLHVYGKYGGGIAGYPGATTGVTSEVYSNTSGMSGMPILVNGQIWMAVALYASYGSFFWGSGKAIPAGTVLIDGAGHWQKTSSACTTGAINNSSPTWNDSGGTTTSGGCTFTDQGAAGTPTTCSSEPTFPAGSTTYAYSGTLVNDCTVTWMFEGNPLPSTANGTTLQYVGSATLSGFTSGFFGLWADTDTPTHAEYQFTNVQGGEGDPCSTNNPSGSAVFTCTGGYAVVPENGPIP